MSCALTPVAASELSLEELSLEELSLEDSPDSEEAGLLELLEEDSAGLEELVEDVGLLEEEELEAGLLEEAELEAGLLEEGELSCAVSSDSSVVSDSVWADSSEDDSSETSDSSEDSSEDSSLEDSSEEVSEEETEEELSSFWEDSFPPLPHPAKMAAVRASTIRIESGLRIFVVSFHVVRFFMSGRKTGLSVISVRHKKHLPQVRHRC